MIDECILYQKMMVEVLDVEIKICPKERNM